MKTAAARSDLNETRPATRSDADDSRVRLRAPLPPPNHELAEPDFDAGDASPDFLQFLCGRFEVDRERGMALLATLLESYVPRESYPIHTLEPRHARSAVSE